MLTFLLTAYSSDEIMHGYCTTPVLGSISWVHDPLAGHLAAVQMWASTCSPGALPVCVQSHISEHTCVRTMQIPTQIISFNPHNTLKCQISFLKSKLKRLS